MMNVKSHNRINKSRAQYHALQSLSVIVFCAGLVASGWTIAKPADNGPSTENRTEQKLSLDELVVQANREFAIGTDAKAIALLEQAGKENPASTVPWLILSDHWFKAEKYPSAILDANEVLKRDPQNQEAKSILVMSGLRVASKAMVGLVPQSPVNSDVRAEAEHLTQEIGDALGEKKLVAAPERKPVPSKHHYKHVYKQAPVAASKAGGNPARSVPSPFSSLK
jgi:hypothetical protein